MTVCTHCEEGRISRCSYADCPFEVEQANETIARLQEQLEAVTRERDEAKAEVARYWTSADMKPWCDLAESKGLGHFGKKLKGMFSRAMKAEDEARIEFDRAEAAEARAARLEAALRRISDMCPATQEMTVAHMMADEAEAALDVKEAG